jgi:hypothetical protein
MPRTRTPETIATACNSDIDSIQKQNSESTGTDLVLGLRNEWWETEEHDISDGSKCPHVHFKAIARRVVGDHLGSDICRAATHRKQRASDMLQYILKSGMWRPAFRTCINNERNKTYSGKAKVDQTNGIVGHDHDVFGFDISVHDAQFVKILQEKAKTRDTRKRHKQVGTGAVRDHVSISKKRASSRQFREPCCSLHTPGAGSRCLRNKESLHVPQLHV